MVECYRVKVPEGVPLTGFTASGQRVPVVPGEHVVHRVKPKVPLEGVGDVLRFLGADRAGRDVHIPASSPHDLEAVLGAVREVQNSL